MAFKALERAMASAAAVILCATGSATAGSTVLVDVGPGFAFTPSEIVIQTGDTVQWVWQGGMHNVVSGVPGAPDGHFVSGEPTSEVGTTFEVTFDQAFLDDHPMPDNVYPYFCLPHAPVMQGTITVEPKKFVPGDLNEDGVVDVSDLLMLLGAWGECGEGETCTGDLNGDSTVDVSDLLMLLGQWG